MEKYSFLDFKKDIVQAGLESAFEYNGKLYYLSMEPGEYRIFRKNKKKSLWVLYNDTDDVEVIKSHHETICDEIIIDGKKLEEIWDEVTIV